MLADNSQLRAVNAQLQAEVGRHKRMLRLCMSRVSTIALQSAGHCLYEQQLALYPKKDRSAGLMLDLLEINPNISDGEYQSCDRP